MLSNFLPLESLNIEPHLNLSTESLKFYMTLKQHISKWIVGCEILSRKVSLGSIMPFSRQL